MKVSLIILCLLLCLLKTSFEYNMKINGMNFTTTDPEIADILHYGFHLTKYNISVLIKKPLRKIMVSELFY